MNLIRSAVARKPIREVTRQMTVNWPALIIIKFAIIQHHFCEILHWRFTNNWRASLLWRRGFEGTRFAPTPRTVTHAAGLAWISSVHIKLCFGLYTFFAIKFALVSLVDSGALGENLDWLDCYLLGRLRFPGKANKIGNAIAFGLVFLCTFTRLYLVWLIRRKKLNFPSLEFLLSDQQDILDSQIPVGPAEEREVLARVQETGRQPPIKRRTRRSQSQWQCKIDDADSSNLNVNLHLRVTTPMMLINREQQHQDQHRDDGGQQQHDYWILRPNRTHKCWLILTRFCNWSAYCLAIILFLTVTTSPITYGGSVLTDFGYELAYPTCVAWIQKQQSLSGAPTTTGHIYRVEPTDKVLAYDTPIDDLPAVIKFATSPQIVLEWRPYNIARIAFDFFEIYAIYVETLLQTVSMTFLVLLNTIDVVLNYRGISRQLERLIEQCVHQRRNSALDCDGSEVEAWQQQQHEKRSSSRSPTCKPSIGHLRPLDGYPYNSIKLQNHVHLRAMSEPWPPCLRGLSNKQLDREITQVQELIYDHFRLIRGYEQFNNFTLATKVLHWILYTITVIIWIPSIKSNNIDGDFYLYEMCGIFFVLLLLAIASVVHSRNVLLYRQITRLMALDPTKPLSKLRWINLMNFYYPKPLFCFTLYGNTEIAWVFCLKLITWVTSAFVLMGKFFNRVRN